MRSSNCFHAAGSRRRKRCTAQPIPAIADKSAQLVVTAESGRMSTGQLSVPKRGQPLNGWNMCEFTSKVRLVHASACSSRRHPARQKGVTHQSLLPQPPNDLLSKGAAMSYYHLERWCNVGHHRGDISFIIEYKVRTDNYQNDALDWVLDCPPPQEFSRRQPKSNTRPNPRRDHGVE
jgi:hypothetical protein